MKKLFTLMAAALMAVSASAEDGKLPLNLSEATNGWGENSINSETGEITIVNNGAYGWWTSGPGDAIYTKLVLQMEDVQKSSWFQLTLSGDANFPLDEGSYVKVIDISSVSAINRVMFQGGNGSKYAIKEAYFATDAYIAANNVKDEKVFGDTQELSLASLGSGWNADYVADTKTITITGEDGGGKGWWVKPADYSHFDNFVVEFDPATTEGGSVVVQYVDDSDNTSTIAFNAGATCVVVALDATRKAAVQQMYIQGAQGATFTLKNAYLAIASATPEANVGTADEGGEEATGKSWDFTSLSADVIAALEADTKWVSSTQGSGETAFTRYTYSEEIAKDTYVDLGSIGFAAGAGIEVGRAGNKMTGGSTIRVDANNRIQLNCSNGVFKIKDLKAGDVVKIRFASASATEARTFTVTNADKSTLNATFTPKDDDAGTDAKADVIDETLTVTADGDLVLQQSKAINIYTITVTSATGIHETVAPVKVIENGAIYNLAGQRVNENYKGIVIKNGKKYIQK